VQNQVIKLTPAIETKIKAFDFTNVDWLDATRLAKHPACKPALVKWFDEDPGPWARGTVPDAIQLSESSYIGQLLKVYSQKGPASYPDAAAALACPDVGPNLRQQRTRFFDSIAFERFYRDSTPKEYLKNFRDEIYLGVVDIHEGTHLNQYVRLGQVMTQAAVLQASGVLGKHASPPSNRAHATNWPTKGYYHGTARPLLGVVLSPFNSTLETGIRALSSLGSVPPASLRFNGDDLAGPFQSYTPATWTIMTYLKAFIRICRIARENYWCVGSWWKKACA